MRGDKIASLVGGVILALAMAVAAVVLVQIFRGYRTVERELAIQRQKLEALNRRDPFPSIENVKMERNNVALMKGLLDDLIARLSKEQAKPLNIEPADFSPLLERTVNELGDKAGMAKVVLPERFAFGFDRYFAGALPRSEDIPRLTIQLEEIRRICMMMFESQIAEILSVKREEFEPHVGASGVAQAGIWRGRRAPESREESPERRSEGASGHLLMGGLVARERFEVTFKSRESALWDLLDRLVRSGMFVVAVVPEMRNEKIVESGAGLTRVKAAGGRRRFPWEKRGESEGRSKTGVLSRDERIVAGREEVVTRLVLDVYRFSTDKQDAGGS